MVLRPDLERSNITEYKKATQSYRMNWPTFMSINLTKFMNLKLISWIGVLFLHCSGKKTFDRWSDWLIISCFTSRSRIFHLHGDVTIAGEGLGNLGLCSTLRAFEQGGIFIVPHLLWHGASVFPISSEGPPHSIASYDTQGDVENLF
jgi:hypothetical protein